MFCSIGVVYIIMKTRDNKLRWLVNCMIRVVRVNIEVNFEINRVVRRLKRRG